MGRPETALVGSYGPQREFAARLRRLRRESGGRSYRQLARSANFAASTLAKAASGRTLPSWEVTRAYVAACGGDPAQWRSAWTDAAVRACAAGADQSPSAAAPGSQVRQLPADLHDFVGRDAEFQLVRDALRARLVGNPAGHAPTVVVISGQGGVGKTTFAVHAAHRLMAEFPDGQLFAVMCGHDDQPAPPAQVAEHFLAALGVRADPSADPVASFRSQAAGRRLLILLDNAADEAQITPLLPGSAQCLVIVTSRQALGGLASARALRLDVLGHDEAVEMLERIAGPGQFESVRVSAQLAELCAYLPLALRIAGARLAGGPPRKSGWLAARLRDENHRLRYLATGVLDLSAVFAVSYRLLPESTRRTFQHVGMFPGSDFTAAALAALGGQSVPEAECELERLADASLVQLTDVGRYRIHDLLHLYARQCADRANTPAELASAIRRLAAWYLVGVQEADGAVMPGRSRPAPLAGSSLDQPESFADRAAAITWYDAEEANLIAVTNAAVRHGQHEIAWRLPVAMRGLLELRGRSGAWITAHLSGLESARAIGDHQAEAWVLNGLGTGYWRREAYLEATDCYRKALALRTELADHRGAAAVLNNLGSVYGAMGQYDDAVECLREALAIRERIGDDLDKSYALNSLGHIEHERGDFSAAIPLLQDALRIRRQLGNRNGEAATLHCLGDALAGLRRYSEALACFRRALLIFRGFGNRYGEAVTLHSLGSTCRAMGRLDHARRYLMSAISLYRCLGRQTEEAAAARELSAAYPGCDDS